MKGISRECCLNRGAPEKNPEHWFSMLYDLLTDRDTPPPPPFSSGPISGQRGASQPKHTYVHTSLVEKGPPQRNNWSKGTVGCWIRNVPSCVAYTIEEVVMGDSEVECVYVSRPPSLPSCLPPIPSPPPPQPSRTCIPVGNRQVNSTHVLLIRPKECCWCRFITLATLQAPTPQNGGGIE